MLSAISHLRKDSSATSSVGSVCIHDPSSNSSTAVLMPFLAHLTA